MNKKQRFYRRNTPNVTVVWTWDCDHMNIYSILIQTIFQAPVKLHEFRRLNQLTKRRYMSVSAGLTFQAKSIRQLSIFTWVKSSKNQCRWNIRVMLKSRIKINNENLFEFDRNIFIIIIIDIFFGSCLLHFLNEWRRTEDEANYSSFQCAYLHSK